MELKTAFAALFLSFMSLNPSCAQNIKPEFVMINGHQQWIYYIGDDTSKQVILFLHGGPGTPETPFLVKYNQNLKEDFIVVCWEQRGAGKSYNKKIPDSTMTIDQFVEDCHAVTQHIKKKFNFQKIYLMGHSWGTLIGIKSIKKYPHDYLGYFALAQISNTLKEEQVTYQWLINQSQYENNRKALRQLNEIGWPSEENRYSLKQVFIKIKWVNYYGGAAFYQDPKGYKKLVKIVITTPVYNFREKLKYLKSEKFSLDHLHDEIMTLDLFEEVNTLNVPIVFIHGTGDYQVPLVVAKEYYYFINSPYKKFIEFKNCAHGLLIEQPEKFKKTILEEVESINAISR
ncbi:MAG: alpha/beta fold hydrolase [Cytophagaceae bacterium]